MAARNNLNKKTNAKNVKPEQVIRAQKRILSPIQKPQKPQKPKPKKAKKHISMHKLGRKPIKRSVFLSIVSIFLALCVLTVWVVVSKSLQATYSTLNDSVRTASGGYVAAKKESDLIKIIGTKLKRRSEITNYQSAPASLQKFLDEDYKIFKSQCVSNKTLPSDVGYELTNVIYDSFAVVRRTCNGTEAAIVKKFDTNWAVIFTGNTLPSCSTVNDLSIPQGASMQCIENGVTYLNPNP